MSDNKSSKWPEQEDTRKTPRRSVSVATSAPPPSKDYDAIASRILAAVSTMDKTALAAALKDLV